VRIKRIQAHVIVGLLLLILITPQSVLADGPVISDVDKENITSTTATITWSVNTSSTITENRVFYGTGFPLRYTAYNTTNTTNPSITLTDLTPGTKYYFAVRSTDDSGTTTDDKEGQYYYFTTSPAYSISLEPTCGVCGELIEPEEVFCNEIIQATVVVPAAGIYHICWDTKADWDEDKLTGTVETFTTDGAAVRTCKFFLPEAKKGDHTVYLTDNAYAEKAKTTFEVSPSVKIDSEEGPVDTEVTLNGYGFTASQNIRVTLFQGEVKKGDEKTAKADDKGSWTVFYTIPHTPGGGYIFKVEGKEGTVWVNWVSKYFEVTSEITATPEQGTVGHAIEIKGTGFGKDEKNIQVTFDGEVRAEGIVANENGSWSRVITVPPRRAGTYIIEASGTLTRARDVPGIEFPLEPGILLEPNPAYVGETITVSGGGFRPGETGIKVSFGGRVMATVAVADISGCWEASFELPPSPHGANNVSAQGDITAPVTNTLTVKTKIEGISPVEGSPGDFVTLTGSGFSSNKNLTVTVGGKNADLEDARSQTNGNINVSFRVPKGSLEGKQTLTVTDEDGATASVDFTVTKKTLSTTPLPISPSGSTLRSGEVTFKWQGVTGDTSYTYTLEISKAPGSGNIWFKSGIEGSSYTLTEDEALPKGIYYWRIKIVDDYGNEGAWSDSIEFTVSPIPTWVWVVVGLVVLVVLMVVAYRETKFKVAE